MKKRSFCLGVLLLMMSLAQVKAQVPTYTASPSATITGKPNIGINLFNRPTVSVTPTRAVTPTATIRPVATSAASITTQPQTGVDMGVWLAILAILASGLGLWRIAWVRAKGF